MIIAARCGQAVGRVAQMPFPGQIGAVAASAQLIGNGHHAVVEVRVIAGLALMFRWDCLGHVAQAGTVVDHARLQHRPRGRAGAGDVEIRKTHTLGRERVDIGRRNFAAEGPDITEPPIIGKQDDDVGAFRRGRVGAGRKQMQQGQSSQNGCRSLRAHRLSKASRHPASASSGSMRPRAVASSAAWRARSSARHLA